MKLDPVLTEIRRAREAYAERFAGDVRAMLADIVERQRQGGRQVVVRAPKRIERQPVQQGPVTDSTNRAAH